MSDPATSLPLVIHTQYIKDFSLENPHGLDAMRAGQGNPVMDVDFSIDSRSISIADHRNSYEVTLGVKASATRGGQVMFIVELQYAVVVSLQDVAEDLMHPLLFIEMPRYAFPFARQIVASMTQQAGYLPLLLTPVDFRQFYQDRFARNPTA